MKLVFFLLLVISLSGRAQTSDANAFLRYLMAKRFFDEAILEANRLTKHQPENDTTLFLLGLAHYEKKDLKWSLAAWDNIPPASPLFLQTQFLKGFSQTFLGHPNEGWEIFQRIVPHDSLSAALRTLEMAGVQLLRHDFPAFRQQADGFGRISVLKKQEDNLMAYAGLLQKKRRKPWKAGVLQLALPGAGYYYAGYKGHAIYNLLLSTLLGLQAWEGYRKRGPESVRFIGYASAFAVLHIASVWGSTLAVKMRREEREKTIHDQILIDMHIPIRTVFR